MRDNRQKKLNMFGLAACLILNATCAFGESATRLSKAVFLEKYFEYALVGNEGSEGKIVKFKADLMPPRLVPLPLTSIASNGEEMQLYAANLALLARHFRLRSVLSNEQIKILSRDEFTEFITKSEAPRTGLPGLINVFVGSREELRRVIYINGQDLDEKQLLKQIWDFEHPDNRNNPYCHTELKLDSGNVSITNASIFIQTEANFGKCFNAGVFEAFGLNRRVGGDERSSILDEASLRRGPSDFDWTLWRFHNSPKINSGMTRQEILAQADQIFNSIDY